MRRLCLAVMTAVAVLRLAAPVWAQTKTVTGEVTIVTATVEAIDASTRTVTLKGPKGNYVDVVAPDSVTRFDEIKVGDKLTARYYDNLVLRVKHPGDAPVDTDAAALTKAPGAKPGATAASQRTITATITAIDRAVPSITFSGPNNWTYSSRVEDKKALATV